MFKRRDIPPVLLLLLLIILVMLTLSQILVVHNGRYGRSVHNMRKLQLELREMDVNLHALMMQNVPSIELNRRILQNQINAHRFAEIISQASHIDPSEEEIHLPSSRLNHGKNDPQKTYNDNVNSTNARPGASVNSNSVPLASSQTERSYSRPIANLTTHGGLHNDSPLIQSDRREDHDLVNTVTGDHLVKDSDHWLLGPPEDDRVLHQPALKETSAELMTETNKSKMPSGRWALYESQRAPSPSAQSKIMYCPSIPPNLKGRFGVNLNNSSGLTWADVARENPRVRPGGTWAPQHCVARHKVAVIIPYRDREQHLITLLYYLHPILQRQQLDYRLFVVEQQGRDTFNKARIMNIAFVEALKHHHFQCFIFHDVDLVPEDDRNMYSCPLQPRHMSVAIDEMGYKLAYQELVGGVLNMRTEHFQKVNGYSNLYWGWGAEDDDMAYRILHVGLKITRPPEISARYKMAKHTKRKPADWRKRAKLLYTGTRRFQFDGLNSLQYKVLHLVDKPLYTHLLVDIGRPPRGF